MSEIDFGRHSDDYATHRPCFPPSFYDRLAAIRTLDGLDVLDLGTGPGFIALELARRGSRTIGLDIAENQIATARLVVSAVGLEDRCAFAVGRAEDAGFPDRSFDLIVAGQCWWWFQQPVTMENVQRMLRPDGMLVVATFNFLPLLDPVAGATEALILKHNPDFQYAGDDGIYTRYLHQLTEGHRFELVEQFCYDHMQPFTHEAWCGRMRTHNAIGSGGLPPDGVEAFDRDLTALLARDFPDQPLRIRHRVYAVIVRQPEGRRE